MSQTVKKSILFCFVIVSFFSGCSQEIQIQQNVAQQQNTQQSPDTPVYRQERTFGSYDVSEQWVLLESDSNDTSSFYVKKEEDITSQTTNISVEYRQNQYTKEQYNVLTSAIIYQLKLELTETLYQSMVSESFESKNGYSVFCITVDDKESGIPVKTIQYYIAGEKAHVLVQVTDFHNERVLDAQKTAREIVDSFIWKEVG